MVETTAAEYTARARLLNEAIALWQVDTGVGNYFSRKAVQELGSAPLKDYELAYERYCQEFLVEHPKRVADILNQLRQDVQNTLKSYQPTDAQLAELMRSVGDVTDMVAPGKHAGHRRLYLSQIAAKAREIFLGPEKQAEAGQRAEVYLKLVKTRRVMGRETTVTETSWRKDPKILKAFNQKMDAFYESHNIAAIDQAAYRTHCLGVKLEIIALTMPVEEVEKKLTDPLNLLSWKEAKANMPQQPEWTKGSGLTEFFGEIWHKYGIGHIEDTSKLQGNLMLALPKRMTDWPSRDEAMKIAFGYVSRWHTIQAYELIRRQHPAVTDNECLDVYQRSTAYDTPEAALDGPGHDDVLLLISEYLKAVQEKSDSISRDAAPFSDADAFLDLDNTKLAQTVDANPAPADEPAIDAEFVDATPAKPEPEMTLEQYKSEAIKLIKVHYSNHTKSQLATDHADLTGCPTADAAYQKFGAKKALALIFEGLTARSKEGLEAIVGDDTQSVTSEPAPTSAVTIAAQPETPTQNAVVPVQSAAVTVTSTIKIPTPYEFDYMKEMARVVCATGLYSSAPTYEKALIIMMKGYTLGVDPLSALDGIDAITIQGKTTLHIRSKLLKALVEKTGLCVKFSVIATDKKATAIVQRKGRQEATYEYTWEDAAKAQLTGKTLWNSHPKKMLSARVISQAIDIEFPEVRYLISAMKQGQDEDAGDEQDVA